MFEVTMKRTRHGGEYRLSAAAPRRELGGRSVARGAAVGSATDAAAGDRGRGRGVSRGARRARGRSGPPARRAQRSRARARHPDRHRPDRGAPAEAARPRRRCGRRAHPLHLEGAAAVPAADEECRGTVALALPEGRFDRPVRGGADGALGPRRTWALGIDRAPLGGDLAAGARAMAAPRPDGPTLRLRLGRWSLLHAAARPRAAVHPRSHWCRCRRPQGAARDRGRLSREHPELA